MTMIVKISNDFNENSPKGKIQNPAHKGDVGYDLIASSHPKIEGEIYQGYLFKRIDYIEYDTNITIEPELDEYKQYEIFSLVYPRSSISNYNLSLCNSVGVIDSGYQNTIKIRFNYICQPENFSILDSKHLLVGIDQSKIYKKGDKIAQIVFSKHVHPKVLSKSRKSNKSSDRGLGGFGSTGK